MTLQPILDCAEDSFSNYDENRDVWMNVRGHCEGLLGAEDFWRYQELCDKDAFLLHLLCLIFSCILNLVLLR